jgi:hypothetical protein
MYILSFDVGLIHISYALIEIKSLEDSWKIIKWNVISVHGIVEKNNKIEYDENNLEFFKSTCKKLKVNELKNKLEYFNIVNRKEIENKKKDELVKVAELYLKKQRVSATLELDLNEIIKRITKYFDVIFHDLFPRLDAVIIENQPCMKNPRMKSIQIAISTYFTIRMHVDNDYKKSVVKFISASAKLNFCKATNKIETIPKNNYKKTKQISVDVVENIIKNNRNKVLLDFETLWKSEKKHDDLTDVVLQAFAYFYNQERKKKQKNCV